MTESLLDILLSKMEKHYDPESWKKFYSPKLNKFFKEYSKNAPLDRINSYDITDFLNSLDKSSERKLNYYNALNAFYSFAFEEEKISNEMLKVEKPIVLRKPPKYIEDNDIIKFKSFIDNDKNKLMDRLLIGILLYTGLPRRYIFDLKDSSIKEGDNSLFSIWIPNENGEYRIPISNKLKPIIKKYKEENKNVSPNANVFKYSQDSAISARISVLSKKITNKNYSPSDFSNTFIKLALSVNPDVYSISKLTLKSVSTIEKHIVENTDQLLLTIQKEIVDEL